VFVDRGEKYLLVFVGIGGIVEHHRLKFIFIINKITEQFLPIMLFDWLHLQVLLLRTSAIFNIVRMIPGWVITKCYFLAIGNQVGCHCAENNFIITPCLKID
jgi:hypothetical protein